MRERLKVALHDSVDEHARVFARVPGRHVHHVGLHDHRAGASSGGGGSGGVEGGDGAVVGEAVVPAHDAEADDVALVVEDLEALGAPGSGQAGDDVNLPERADVAVPADDMAALHEVLVGLRVVEAAQH